MVTGWLVMTILGAVEGWQVLRMAEWRYWDSDGNMQRTRTVNGKMTIL